MYWLIRQQQSNYPENNGFFLSAAHTPTQIHTYTNGWHLTFNIRNNHKHQTAKILLCWFVRSRMTYCNSLLSRRASKDSALERSNEFTTTQLVLFFSISQIRPCFFHLFFSRCTGLLPISKRIASLPLSSHCHCMAHTEYLSDLLPVYTPSHQLRSSSDDKILRLRLKPTTAVKDLSLIRSPWYWPSRLTAR